MRRKFTIAIFFFFLSSALHGQVLISLIFGEALNSGKIEFGLEGGYNWSNISSAKSKKYYGNYNLGFYFDIVLKKPWYFYTGVLVKSNLGTGKLEEEDLAKLNFGKPYEHEGNYAQVTRSFQVPALIKYRFENNLFLLAGLQFNLTYDAWIEYEHETDESDTVVRHYNKDETNKLDFGAMAGIGYKIKEKDDHGLSFSFRYYYGFLDVYKTIAGSNNSSFFLEMTIPIGAE